MEIAIFGEILHLTKGWKIGIIGLTVAAIGLILFVINIYLGRMEFPYFLISNIVWFVGMTIIYVGIQKRQAERKKDYPKT